MSYRISIARFAAATVALAVSASLYAQSVAFEITDFDRYDAPWALEFLPDGRLLLSEQAGALKLLSGNGELLGEISGVPEVDFAGQGGLGDIVLHPQFARNNEIYISYAEGGRMMTRGAAVARAELALTRNGG
ncbi:MAG TPA: PQQ-dependent sugar dehydrogenase, partial [Gammaproteobacteria bacterium]